LIIDQNLNVAGGLRMELNKRILAQFFGWVVYASSATIPHGSGQNNMFAGDGNFKLRTKTDDIRIKVTWSQNSF